MKRLLATFVFTAAASNLTLFAGTTAASAGPSGVVTPAPSAVPSVATAALADGDDIPARFIFESSVANELSAAKVGVAAADEAALSLATAAILANGDDIRARWLVSVQH